MVKIAENALIIGLAISLVFNVFVPFFLWLGWDGVRFKLNRWGMKKGGSEATLFVTKNNILKLMWTKIKSNESSLKIKDGIYSRTPSSELIYWFKGVPLKIRRENDPEEYDLWERENVTGMTAKEIDNVVNEQMADSLVAMLKMYFPMILVVVALLAIMVVFSIYFNFSIFENMKVLAKDLVKFIPESLRT